MTYTLIPQLWYTITPATDCDVSTPNGISIHLPAGIQYFHFADGTSIDITGEAAVTQNPPLFRPASASALGGGYIESNLYVGHGAADAVAAVCTLTPGDLSQGGTLTDGTTTLTLENPHTKATGWVGVADATAAGTIKFGGHEAISFAAKADAYASAEVTPLESYGAEQEYTLYIAPAGIGDTLDFSCTVTDPENALDEIVAALETASNWFDEATQSVMDEAPVSAQVVGGKIVLTLAEAGEVGNAAVVFGGTSTLIGETDDVPFAGGSTARTVRDLVYDINHSQDAVEALLDADELGISFTAKEYGVNDTITITGGLFEDAGGMEGGHGDYSVQEIAAAINAKTDFAVTAAAAETEGAITLTANTPGAAANAVVYTATGCFGSGSVKQGSTVRGKDAAVQTDFEIILNGNQPHPLTPATAMKNGWLYTVDAAGTALDFSAVTLPAYAVAEVWLDYVDVTSVTFPPGWLWLTGDGASPAFDFFKHYRLEVQNDGRHSAAKVLDSYALYQEYLHTELTQQNQSDSSLELYILPAETSSGYGNGYAPNIFAGKVFNAGAGKYNLSDSGQNITGGEFSPPDTPQGYRFPFGAITFMTSRAVDFHALAIKVDKRTDPCAVYLQAWTGEAWETCCFFEGADYAGYYIAPVTHHVTATKWRLLAGSAIWMNWHAISSVRFFEQ